MIDFQAVSAGPSEISSLWIFCQHMSSLYCLSQLLLARARTRAFVPFVLRSESPMHVAQNPAGAPPEFLERTQRLFGREALLTLRGRRIAVAGCGGVGGATSILLARLGVERFHLADPGAFD